MREAGLMERRRGYYAALIGITAAVFLLATAGFVVLGDSWWSLALAPVFAVLFTHFGFIGHDAGHGQILSGARGNNVLGYLHGNLLIGLGYGWWTDKHTAHHANPNHEDKDPDVQIGALAFSTDQARGRRGVAAFSVRHQAVLFFPLLLLEGLSLHVSAIQSVVRNTVKNRGLEVVLLALHAVLYLGTVFAVLSPVKAVVFVLVHQGLFGLYLGCSFAPNHKGMPIVSARDQLDPVRRQVLTSRNIRGGVLVDQVLGGLNYQIEHHLFVRMPRPNLRHAQPLVAEFCARQGINYAETGLLDSYAQTLRHLHAAGAPLRGATA
jgi:fatty acid desaturase